MKNKIKTYSDIEDELKTLRNEYNHLKILHTKDNSERILLEDSLAETNSKLRLALDGGDMAWWEMNVKTGAVTFDKHKVEMIGYSPENFKHHTDFTSLVHPDDYKGIMHAMNEHFNGTKDKYEAEYRIRAKSGEYKWFYEYGSVVKREENGNPLIFTGFVFNITVRKNAEKRMAYIVKAIDSANDAIVISDNQGHQFYQNKAFSDLFEYETPEETEASGGGKATIKDPEITKELFGNIMSGKSWLGELEMVTKSGRVFSAYESANAIKDPAGNILGLIGIISDITERKKREEALVQNKNKLQAE